MARYVGYSEVKKHYKVGTETVRNWARNGSIGYKTIQNAKKKTWLYDLESIGKLVDKHTAKKPEGRKIIYARVSSKKQEEDLKRQIDLLKEKYPDYELIKDIGSGLNFKRPGFTKLVEGVCRNDIQEIVVTYRDRLCRFGQELFEQICEEHKCKIVVLSQVNQTTEVSETEELQEDLLSIVNVFVARRNGKRAGQLKQIRREAKEKKDQENQIKPSKKEERAKLTEENSTLPNSESKSNS